MWQEKQIVVWIFLGHWIPRPRSDAKEKLSQSLGNLGSTDERQWLCNVIIAIISFGSQQPNFTGCISESSNQWSIDLCYKLSWTCWKLLRPSALQVPILPIKSISLANPPWATNYLTGASIPAWSNGLCFKESSRLSIYLPARSKVFTYFVLFQRAWQHTWNSQTLDL